MKLIRMRKKAIIILFLAFTCFAYAVEENNSTDDAHPEHEAMGYLDALVYGLVEGLTEFLPVSSTGHLILAKEFLEDTDSEELETAINAYLIVIQAGAILAVAILYWRDVWAMGLGVLGLDPRGRSLARNLLLAFLPAAILGPLLDEFIEERLFGALPVAIALFLGGFLIFSAERMRARRERSDASGPSPDLSQMKPTSALVIGAMQCVAMWPGTSRSMMTIVGGYIVGLRPAKAAEFSFLLGLVTLTAAAGYKVVTKGHQMAQHLSFGPVLIGCLVAGVSAALSVRWLVGYLARRGLAIFGWYRILLSIIIFVLLGIGFLD